MKKLIISFFAAIMTFAAMAQDKAPHTAYAELVGTQKGLFSRKVTVTVDLGQAVSFWKASKDAKIVDEDGKDIVFNSMVDAMNYMGARGWKFLQAYNISEGSQNVYRWLLAKEVSDESEITSGLNLKADFSNAEKGKYLITYLKRPANRPDWDVEKEETKIGITPDELETLISDWKSQTSDRYIYDCRIKKEK